MITNESLSDRHLTYMPIGESDIKKHQVMFFVPVSCIEDDIKTYLERKEEVETTG